MDQQDTPTLDLNAPLAPASAQAKTPQSTTSTTATTLPAQRVRRHPLAQLKDDVVGSATRQVADAGSTAAAGVTSGAWMYPLYGLAYILSHPKLLVPVLPRLLRALLISAAVVAVCFFFLYLPQVAWLALFSGPFAFFAAVPLVLGEAYVLLMFLGKNFLVGPLNTDLFDAVLVQKGYATLVQQGRPVHTKSNNARQLGIVLTRPVSKFNTDNIVRYLLTLPLNMIPVVGTAFFLCYNGYKSGPGCHARYFQLKGWDKDRRDAFIRKNRGAYTAFGVVSLLFNLVPVVSVLLSLCTSVGAAIWAVDIENHTPKSNPQVNYPVEVDVSLPEQ